MKAQFNYLIENIARIKIPNEMVESIKRHSRNVRIRFRGFDGFHSSYGTTMLHDDTYRLNQFLSFTDIPTTNALH